MISVGIFTGYYPYILDETIRRIKEGGFSCVQLDVSFKDCDAARETLTKAGANRIRDAFRDANIPVIAVSAYTNFVHPDPGRRKANIEYLKMLMRLSRELGCPYVASETGTYDPESDWVWHDKNGTSRAYDEAVKTIGELARYGADYGSTFIIENYVNNVIGSVDQVERMFRDVDEPNVGLICDPTNYFDDANIDRVDETLRDIFTRLSPYMKIAHAKDCRRAEDTGEKHADIDADESHSFRGSGSVELPAAGLGVLDYELYVKLLSEDHPNIPLIIEHLDEGDIPRAKGFVDGCLKRVGV